MLGQEGWKVKRHRRATTWTLIVIGALTLAGCGGSSSPAVWTGMGAKLADWESAHPKSSTATGCTSGCYGDQVMDSGTLTPAFKLVETTGAPEYRVDGYEQAIGDGTSLADAKAAILALLPRDTRTTSFRVAHGEGSCALWNVHSPTLGGWFAGKHVGDAKGDLGILLDTANANGEAELDPSNVSHANVSIVKYKRRDRC